MGNKKRASNYHPRKKKKYYGPKKTAATVSSSENSASEQEVESRCSASFKKLSSSWWWNRDSESDSEADGADDSADTGDDEDVVFVDGATTRGNCIADLEILKSILLTYAVCAICKTGKLLLRETGRQGLGSKVSLSCTSRKCPS